MIAKEGRVVMPRCASRLGGWETAATVGRRRYAGGRLMTGTVLLLVDGGRESWLPALVLGVGSATRRAL